MDIRIFIFDGLKFFKFLSIPKVNRPVDCHCDDLVLLIIKEDVQDFCVNMCLDASDDTQGIWVNQ